MSIFKPCDIRGVVGEEWDTPEARRIGEALGRLLARRGERRIFVGGDYRRSTPRLKAALIDALRSTGIAVRDLGQVPTPLVYFAALQQGCPNVAIVTASHNPAQYNGVKVMVAGQPGVPELLKE
ncbi:MAG: phosphomannomutase/phosphoglucomutase, partial [Planctomycetes bacterium]|nr:phosphomannomutase/phosphoglucomutase [Planctomycetota bacterium]